jgi:dipeptidyl aminopeptidase/acylaminoacyl peptidase
MRSLKIGLSVLTTSFVVSVVSLLVAPAPTAATERLTPEMVVELKSVADAVISPYGEHIAYVLRVPRTAEEEKGADHQEIWLMSASGQSEPTRFITGPGDAWSPQWSPTGDEIAFLSDRGKQGDEDSDEGGTQVYVISLSGGEARKLTDAETSVSSFKWSPDGKWIAYVASDPKTKEQKDAEKNGEDWTVVDKNLKPRRLWAVNVETLESHKVTGTDISVWDFNWAPEGDRLVISTTEEPRTDDSYMLKRLHLVPAAGGEPTLLCETEGKLGEPRWSPDGKYIAFRGAVSLNDPFDGSLFVVAMPSGKPVNLTPNLPASITSFRWQNVKTLMFTAIEGTRTTLNTISVNGEGLRTVFAGDPVFYNLSLSRDGQEAAVAASTPAHPSEVFLWKPGGLFRRGAGTMTKLTNVNPSLQDVELAAQEVVHWTSKDGLEIEGILMKPLDFQEGKRYPLVVQPHGGPEGACVNGWTTSWGRWSQLLASKGYVVFMPNFRGSIGRGVEFSKRDHKDLGGADFQDILDGIDYLIAQGLVDKDRVGIGGTSYGGYMSAWAATAHSDRFAAAIDHAGISNWISFTGTTDIPYEMCTVHWDFWVFDNADAAWERSPMAHLEAANTPLLICHGKADERVNPEQALQLYTALKYKGVETELVLYPRASHGFRERAQELDYMTRALKWFDDHLMPGR